MKERGSEKYFVIVSLCSFILYCTFKLQQKNKQNKRSELCEIPKQMESEGGDLVYFR